MNDKTTIPKRLRVLRRSCRLYGLRTMLTLLLLLCATKAYPQAQWREVQLPTMPIASKVGKYGFGPMEWADSLHGYIFAQYNGYYCRTTDGGVTWVADSITATSEFPLCSGVDFKTKDFGVVTYSSYRRDTLVFFTTNGGATWGYNPVSTPSRFKNTMNPPGSQLRVDANRALFLYYTQQYDDSVIANVVTRSDDYGATWRELGADTVNRDNQIMDHDRQYVLLDSLTHFYFTSRYNMGEFSGSWARVTTDGGRRWDYFPDWHPLAHLSAHEISEVRMINDTSVSIRLFASNRNGGLCIVSRDIRNFLDPAAWYVYGHPYTWPTGGEKLIYDLLYHDGTYIARIEDSVMVYRENPPERAQKVHVPGGGGYNGSFYLQPNGRLWHLYWGALWVLDYRTLGSVGTLPEPSPDIEGFECYPQPFTSNSGVLTLRMNSKQRHAEVELVVYDANGRRLYEREIGDIAPGRSEAHLDLSDASLSQLPSNAVLFIELRTQHQRFYTKSLFLNKK